MSSAQATGRSRLSMPVLGLFTGLAVVQLLNGTVQGYLPPVLPAVGAKLGIDTVGQNRLLATAVLSSVVLIPLISRLGDLYGHRRVLRVSVAVSTAGSLLIAAWPTPATLLVGVVLQGPAIGFFPLMIGIMRSRAPEYNRAGIGMLGGVVMAAVAASGLVGGILSERQPLAGLWVTVPVSALAFGAALLLPESVGPRVGRFHGGSALLLSVGLVGVMLAVSEGPSWGWASVPGLVALFGGVLALVAWALVESRTAHPLVNLRLFRNRGLATVLGIVFCVGFAGLGFVGPNITFLAASPAQVGYGMGLGPQSLALVGLALIGLGAVSSPLAPLVLRRLGARPTLVTGTVLTAVSFVLMALWHDTLAEYMVGLVVLGLATGLFQVVARTLAVEAVAEDHTALAAGLTELCMGLGAATGSAVLAALLAVHPLGTGRYVAMSGYLWCWGVCAGMSGVGLALVLARRGHGTAL
ncbi:MAG: MFS transporter, partial [Kutzneria sp.]|nr:MFS transporter [Kutzneria sp.]